MKVIGNLTKDAIIKAVVSEGQTFTQAVGTPVDVDTVATTNIKVAFDSSNNKVVVAYTDQGDTYEGNAVVGTVDPSDNSISFGTPVAFYSGETGNDYLGITFDSNSNKIVIVYSNVDESNDGYAVVGTVSGTSISFGTPVEWSPNNTTMLDCTFDSSNNKVVIVWKDQTNSDYGTAIVGTVSGTSISFGSAVVFNSNNTSYPQATFDTSNNKVVITYRNQSTTHGTAIVGTVSGTSISFGSATAWLTSAIDYQSITFDSTNNKVIVVGNSSGGYAAVGTVSGTSISFGSAVAFTAVSPGSAEYNDCAFDSNTGKVVIVYKQRTTDRPALIVGEVSGTSISFGTAITLQSETTNGNRGITFDSNAKKIVTVYKDSDDNRGEAVVFQTAGSVATGGTIANGSAVILNANGTVSSVGQSALTEAKGSEVEFEAGGTYNQGVVYDSANDKVVIVYSDAGNSDYGTAIVGTVSGDSISFGTAVVFESATTSFIAPVFDSSNNKIVVAYRDGGNSGAGTAIVGTVSGTSISFGTAVVFESGNSNNFIDASFDTSANKVVIVFRDNDDSNNGKAIVGTVSGTSISFGSANTFLAATTQNGAIAYDVANDRHVIACQYTSGIAIVATVTGTSIAFGSQSEFETGSIIHTKALYDPNIERVHIFYGDAGDSDKGKAVIGTVSDTSISFTGQATFYGSAQVTDIGASFNTSINAITLATRDNGGALNMYTSTATTSAYTFGSAFSIDTGVTNGNVNNAHVSTADRTVLAFTDVGDSNKGKAVVYTGAGTNLTTKNFVGFMDSAALDGTNGEILSSCAIARNQTSLTPGQTYFVSPTDGALSLTAGDPSVTAGTAISNTELIVKG